MQLLMETDVEGLIGVGQYERSGELIIRLTGKPGVRGRSRTATAESAPIEFGSPPMDMLRAEHGVRERAYWGSIAKIGRANGARRAPARRDACLKNGGTA
jgi:hypothetical protein